MTEMQILQEKLHQVQSDIAIGIHLVNRHAVNHWEKSYVRRRITKKKKRMVRVCLNVCMCGHECLSVCCAYTCVFVYVCIYVLIYQ